MFFFSINLFTDPLEQFANVSIFTQQYNCPTNLTNSFMSVLAISAVLFLIINLFLNTKYKKNWVFYILKYVEIIVKTIINDNSKTLKKTHLMAYLYLFLTIALINLSGLIPFSWTLTSWFTPVFLLGATFFYQINVLLFFKKKYFFFTQFVPLGTPLIIIPFLTIIELVSYLSRVISLSVRLFANMLSGHALLKILISFSFSMFKKLTIASTLVASIIWLGVSIIFLLEIMVALLQAYVFTLLLNIYFNDVFAEDH